MERRLFLDVVVRKSAIVFELFPSKDKTLLVRWSPDSPKFPKGADYILSYIKFAKLSFVTDNHLVSEPSPYSGIANLGAWMRIAQFLSFLPYTRQLTCPDNPFRLSLVDRTLRGFPQFDCLASGPETLD